MTTLAVLLADRISDWAAKGEIVDGYLNPLDRFDTVHIVLCNDDNPDPEVVQRLVGTAQLHVHNVPSGMRTFLATAGWRPTLLRRWAEPGIRILADAAPDIVRCSGTRLNAYLACLARRRLGIPYVVSVHTILDPRLKPALSIRDRIVFTASLSIERSALREADRVLPVYGSIVPKLEAWGVTRHEVVLNAVGETEPKSSWSLDPAAVRAIAVQRQLPGKDPTPIVEALAPLHHVHLELVGDGPLHPRIVQRIGELGMASRVTVLPSLPNEIVLEHMRQADMLLYASDFPELSKACIEAGLIGLPAIVSRALAPVPELGDGHAMLVDGSPESFRDAVAQLVDSSTLREGLGRSFLAYAREHWPPAAAELRLVAIYDEVMAEPRRAC